jgi:hypothetical protein
MFTGSGRTDGVEGNSGQLIERFMHAVMYVEGRQWSSRRNVVGADSAGMLIDQENTHEGETV